jgi:RNA-splicing ligase RtcB
MRDGSLIVKGKGNPDWNFSGPHGAGRILSRSAAKETLKMEDFKSSMKGIYTTSVSAATIDESPMAYKPMEEIINNINDTCDIVARIIPVWNVKAGDEE